MPEVAERSGRPAPGGGAPPFIRNEDLRRNKRKSALRTFWFPVLGATAGFTFAAFYGVGWLEIVLFAVMFFWATLGLEVGFHRLFAHRAFKAPMPVQVFFWASALMAGQGRGLYWMATHRRHHTYSDTPDDPHSPHHRVSEQGHEKLGFLRGFWHAHQGNTYTDYATNVALFANDIRRDAKLMWLDKQYPLFVTLGIVLPGLVGALYYQTWVGALSCLLWGGPIRVFIQHQTFFTNASLGHMIGEQPFATGDDSRNNWWCAIWTFGSALQNTHHAFPSSAYLKLRWYELDLAGAAIKLMAKVGLARDVRFPTREAVSAKLAPSARYDFTHLARPSS